MKRLLFSLLAPIAFYSSLESKPIPQISDFKVNVELAELHGRCQFDFSIESMLNI